MNFLNAGERKEIRVILTPVDVSIIDDNGIAKQFTGNISTSIGGSQPDATAFENKKVVRGKISINKKICKEKAL